MKSRSSRVGRILTAERSGAPAPLPLSKLTKKVAGNVPTTDFLSESDSVPGRVGRHVVVAVVVVVQMIAMAPVITVPAVITVPRMIVVRVMIIMRPAHC